MVIFMKENGLMIKQMDMVNTFTSMVQFIEVIGKMIDRYKIFQLFWKKLIAFYFKYKKHGQGVEEWPDGAKYEG